MHVFWVKIIHTIESPVLWSPFGVVVNSPLEKFGTPILTLATVGKPWGVAITKGREVIVTEEEEHRMSKFTACGDPTHLSRESDTSCQAWYRCGC